MLESDLQADILKWLKKHNFYAFKVIRANRAGILDINGCTPKGKFFAVEVKIGNNTASELQLYNVEEITSRNGIAFVAWDLETVITGLQHELI